MSRELACVIIQHWIVSEETRTYELTRIIIHPPLAVCARRRLEPVRERPDWVAFAPTCDAGIERLPASTASSCLPWVVFAQTLTLRARL